MAYILGFLLSLRDLALAIFDLVTRRLRRRYTYRTVIKAPKETVRSLFAKPDATFANGRIRITGEPLPGVDGAELHRTFLDGESKAAIAVRKIEDSDDSLAWRYLPEHSENVANLGTDDVFGVSFEALPGVSTRVRMFRELTHRRPATRITAPLGLRTMAWLAKTEAERQAGTEPGRLRRWLTQAAWLAAAIASFWWLVGWEDAAVLTALIVLHELGHALALWMTGRGVRFITLIPFIGGMAMPKRMYESDAQHAFVALMGPGFSLLPTLGLLWYAYSYDSLPAAHACFMFAFINGINLLPLAVLDGGAVVNALLHAIHRRLAQAIAWLGTLAGLAAAFYLQDPVLGIVFVFAGLQLIQQASLGLDLKRKRLRWFQAPVVLVALILTCCAYAIAIMHASKLGYALEALVPPQLNAGASAAASGEVPSHCWMPTTSRQALDAYLDAQIESDDWTSTPRILAAAGLAGHGDIVERWLTLNAARKAGTPVSSGAIADFGEALRLARSGTAGDISAFLARSSAGDAAAYRHFTRLLVLNRRYDEAIAFQASNSGKVAVWTLVYELLRVDAWERAIAFVEAQPVTDEILDFSSDFASAMSAMNHKAEARAYLERLTERARQDPESGIESSGWPPEALYWLVRFGARDIDLAAAGKETGPKEFARAVAFRVAQLEDAGDAAGAQALLASFAKAPADTAGAVKGKAEPLAVLIERALGVARALVKVERSGLTPAELFSAQDVDYVKKASFRAEYLRQGRFSDAEAWDLMEMNKSAGRLEAVKAIMSPPGLDTAATQRYMQFADSSAKRGAFEAADRFARRSGRILCNIHPKAKFAGLWRAWFARNIYLLKAVEEGRLPPAVLDQP